MPFFAQGSGFVLHQSLLGSFTGHAHVQAFQHAIELRVRGPKPPVLRKDFLGEFDDVDLIGVGHIGRTFSNANLLRNAN